MAASPAVPIHMASTHAVSPDVQDTAAPAESSARLPMPPLPHPWATVVRTSVYSQQTGVGSRSVRRKITPTAGFALSILGHAIEYLADEYAHEAGGALALTGRDPRVEAMQLLMAANREVYYSCAIVPSLGQKLYRFLRWGR